MDRGMVDISEKSIVARQARACGKIRLKRETVKLIVDDAVEKGDVIEASKIVAINVAKDTSRILPYCHNIPIEWVGVTHKVGTDWIEMCVTVKTSAKTGVEMEALCSVLAALANIWDMVKRYEKDRRGQYPYTMIYDVRVVEKSKDETETP